MAKIKKAEDKTSPSEFHRLYADVGHWQIYCIFRTPGVIIPAPKSLNACPRTWIRNIQREAMVDKFFEISFLQSFSSSRR